MIVEVLQGKSEESLRVERRGALVWKWFRTRPATCETRWLSPAGWLNQLRLRVAISRRVRLPPPARFAPVVWFDEQRLAWATPFVAGPFAEADEVIRLTRALDAAGLSFVRDVNCKNVIRDARFGGVVVVDFQAYDPAAAEFLG